MKINHRVTEPQRKNKRRKKKTKRKKRKSKKRRKRKNPIKKKRKRPIRKMMDREPKKMKKETIPKTTNRKARRMIKVPAVKKDNREKKDNPVPVRLRGKAKAVLTRNPVKAGPAIPASRVLRGVPMGLRLLMDYRKMVPEMIPHRERKDLISIPTRLIRPISIPT